MDDVVFEAPGPGAWTLDKVHFAVPRTRLSQDLYPDGFSRGFQEGFDLYGVPVQSMTLGFVHGYSYMRTVRLGEPDPDGGSLEPEELMAELAKRAAQAEAAIATRVWRKILAEWDASLKPAAIARHVELGSIDLAALDGPGLAAHVRECIEHHRAMAYQHHRFNTSAFMPPADLCVQAARWSGDEPTAFLPLFEGCSPVSGVWSEEIAPAATAVLADPEARALITGAGPAALRLTALRSRLPVVDEWSRVVGCRIIDGFDVISPTLAETPQLLLSKLAAAVEQGGPKPTTAVEEATEKARTRIPDQHRDEFDSLLADARLAYRLRDERGVYSDISSAGLLRGAALELGRRLTDQGRAGEPTHLFDTTANELLALAGGDGGPSAEELETRSRARTEAASLTPPDTLGDGNSGAPAAPPALPGALGRVLAALGFGFGAMQGTPSAPPSGSGPLRGTPGNGGRYEGRARVVHSIDELLTLEPGDVLVAVTTSEAFNSAIHLVGAIVTDYGGPISHAAIVAREVGIPAVVGAAGATEQIPDGATVVVDGAAGTVTVR